VLTILSGKSKRQVSQVVKRLAMAELNVLEKIAGEGVSRTGTSFVRREIPIRLCNEE